MALAGPRGACQRRLQKEVGGVRGSVVQAFFSDRATLSLRLIQELIFLSKLPQWSDSSCVTHSSLQPHTYPRSCLASGPKL